MTSYKNIAVFGCKSTTLFLIKALKANHVNISHLVTIDPAAGTKNEVADYYDLKAEVGEMGITVYTAKQYTLKNSEDQAHIQGLHIDIAFVIGWQRLLPNDILSGFSTGAFGMHGSSMNLPLGRGRSPMNWSILEGRKVFYTNLFKYDVGVDSGDVVDTYKFEITGRDTGDTMHFKNLLAMKYLIEKNVHNLMDNSFLLTKQRTDISPTYYPKRNPADSLLDWKQDIVAIERFIRAVTRPFNGAFTFVNNLKVIIWDAQIFDTSDFGYTNEVEAMIIAVFPGGKFLVKCFGGLLLVNEYDSDAPIAEGSVFDNGGHSLNYFDRNQFGFFDLP